MLQHKISGDYISLDKMYSIFGRGYVTLDQAVDSFSGLPRPFHGRLYADMGEGFAEGNMPAFDAEVTSDMKIVLDVRLPEGIRKLRIDPQEDYCMIRLLSATVPEAMVNGRVCGSTVIFDNRDPQIIFDIPEGAAAFHLEYMIRMTDPGMYEEILAKLSEYETEPRGMLKKPREKEQYVKVSALHRAE